MANCSEEYRKQNILEGLKNRYLSPTLNPQNFNTNPTVVFKFADESAKDKAAPIVNDMRNKGYSEVEIVRELKARELLLETAPIYEDKVNSVLDTHNHFSHETEKRFNREIDHLKSTIKNLEAEAYSREAFEHEFLSLFEEGLELDIDNYCHEEVVALNEAVVEMYCFLKCRGL